MAAATAGRTWDTAIIPFFADYSMFGFQRVEEFGFQRVEDLIWALADARGRGFLVGATAGRTTVSGEGLQHTDGLSQLTALTVPSCRAQDPAIAYGTATIVRHGIEAMYDRGEENFYTSRPQRGRCPARQAGRVRDRRHECRRGDLSGPLPGRLRALSADA